MELVLSAHGTRITDPIRRAAEERVARLDRRRRPVITRLEVQIIGSAPTSRGAEAFRVHVAGVTSRHTFHAEGAGGSIDTALDIALDRLDRQISTFRSKREARATRAGSSTIPTPTSEEPTVPT